MSIAERAQHPAPGRGRPGGPRRPSPGSSGFASPHLEEVDFCVVDLETTGGAPASSGITEIGAVRMRAGRVLARFATLVDPRRPIPRVVREITGIDDAMVAGAPPLERVLPRFAAFADGAVLVAHNAPFDLRFLNYELRRLERRYFGQPCIDTLSLSRALLDDGVVRHDLASLSTWAGTRVSPSHRALPDAEATAEVLVALIGLAAARGHRTHADLEALAAPHAQRYAPSFALCEELPAAVGVYVLRDGDGRVVRVGAAGNLRRDVRRLLARADSRVAALAADPRSRVEHEVHGSRLGADLRAAGLAHELDAAPRPARPLYISLRQVAGGVSARVVREARGGGAFGPLGNERRVRRAAACLEALFRDPEGCAGTGPDALERASALLSGDARALGRLPGSLRRAAAGRGFDAASRRQVADLMAVLGELAAGRRARDRVAVLVERGRDPGSVELFGVSGGHLRGRLTLPPQAPAEAAGVLLRALRLAPADRTNAASASVIGTLIERRIEERAGHPAAVHLSPDFVEEDALERVGAARDAVAGERRGAA